MDAFSIGEAIANNKYTNTSLPHAYVLQGVATVEDEPR